MITRQTYLKPFANGKGSGLLNLVKTPTEELESQFNKEETIS
jgi:hypothetical protein